MQQQQTCLGMVRARRRRRHGLTRVAYRNTRRGADESYKSIEYYKANLENDASRVNNLFKNAKARGDAPRLTPPFYSAA